MLFSALTPSLLRGQGTAAQIGGFTTDISGASIPGAKVLIVSQDTGAKREVTTNQTGAFVATELEPGNYRITVSAPGFATGVTGDVILTIGQKGTFNFKLKVGESQQTVTVTSAGEQINTTSSELSSVVNEQTIKELPLNGRDPSSLVFLVPGVTNVMNTSIGERQAGTSIPTQTGASAGGGRQGSTYYLLDGVSNIDTYELLAAPFPNADATQEFRVVTNNYDAHYGFAPGAVVSIETKGGSNSLHGNAFEFLRNSAFNAKDYFSGKLDSLHRNQFGGSVGGPIFRDKLFFFANYQGTRQSTTSTSNTAYTPTAAMLAGDFSGDPTTLPAPFATINGKPNQINPALFSHGALGLSAALPLGGTTPSLAPNATASAEGFISFVGPKTTSFYNEDTDRLDYVLSEKQRFALRSFILFYNQPTADIPGNVLSLIAGNTGKYYNEVLRHTWVPSASLVNTLALFWNREDGSHGGQSLDANGQPVCMSKLIAVSSLPGQCYLVGQTLSAPGFTTPSGQPYTYHRTTWGFSEDVTKTLGNHLLSGGVDLWHQLAHEISDYPTNPNIGFTGGVTSFPLADFLLGDAMSFLQGGGEINSQQGWWLGAFAQDQWKVNRAVTLTYGLRWEPTLPPVIAGGHGAAFEPGVKSQVFPNAPTGLVFIGDPGVQNGLFPNDYSKFDPRVGIAIQPPGLPHTSIRAAFGMFISPLQYSDYNHIGDIAPFSPTYSFSGTKAAPIPYDKPYSVYAASGRVSPFPPFASTTFVPPTNSTFLTPLTVQDIFSRNFKLGITQSWNASIQQELGWKMVLQVAYVGSESYDQNVPIDLNPGIFAAAGARTTYTSFSNIYQMAPIGTASYNSLQVSLDKKMSNSVQFQSSFTWSKVLDLYSQSSTAWISYGIADPFDIHHNHGIADTNVPINLITNFIYTTPSLRNHNGFLQAALGAWEMTGIWNIHSGQPFSVTGGNGNDSSLSLQFGDRADVTGQPVALATGHFNPHTTRYFNAAAFMTNGPGTYGNSARNLLHGRDVDNVDAGVYKNWRIRERYGIQFRWEMFNAFNHPTFGLPAVNPTPSSAATFGFITATGSVPARVAQAALKLTF
jgi:hypothetical protein